MTTALRRPKNVTKPSGYFVAHRSSSPRSQPKRPSRFDVGGPPHRARVATAGIAVYSMRCGPLESELLGPPTIAPPAGRPGWSWVFIGPRNSESRLHIDAKMSSAWNAVFSGCKEWRIFPPDHRFSAELRRGERVPAPLQFEPGEAWKAIQYPGDLIYVPGEWAHSVINKSRVLPSPKIL
jgi:hypothetical protein